MPLEQIRTMLFVALCVVMFLMWQQWRIDYAPAVVQTSATQAPGMAGDTPGAAVPRDDVPQAPAVASSVQTSSATPVDVAQQAPVANVNTIEVRTDLLQAVIDLNGGTLADVYLLAYAEASNKKNNAFQLLDDTNTPARYFVAQSGLLGEGAPSHHGVFTAERASYELDAREDELRVVLTAVTDGPLDVRKIYTFKRDSYIVSVGYEVQNNASEPWNGRMYAQFQRMEPPSKGGMFTTYTYTGGVLSNSEKPYEKVSFSDLASADVDRTVDGGWLAMIQHYFLAAWLPGNGNNHYYSKALADGRYVLGVVDAEQSVGGGGVGAFEMRAFLGPKDQDRMKAASEHLERTVDYGWLFLIAEPIFWALQFIHTWVGNWGWSIIILTICIKGCFFHLSATSYKSMARMRKLAPRMKTLRERYGDDRQKLNQAMMEIYKTEKINPLGGCLPIVVQIPVFISLYWVLLESVELRQAPFMFWLQDLSIHDPYFVLPLLMGATMFIQQKLNPAPPDPIQAKVMMALPFVFTFFFLFFPAGLVLYWFVNNLLSIAQQWVITKKIVGST